MHGSRKQLSSSGTWDLYRNYADSPEDLVELMRRIVSRGGRGRKQDNVPKEVSHRRMCATRHAVCAACSVVLRVCSA